MPDWTFVITGCGTSHGNPTWGEPARWSSDPRDRRRRSGAMLFGPAGERVLFDVGPDLMWQLKDPFANWDGVSYPEHCVTRCDGVILTHVHADHCHGVNDLRHLNRLMRKAGLADTIAIHGWQTHLEELMRMFPYCFGFGEEAYSQGKPALVTTPVADDVPFHLAGLTVTPFAMSHGPPGRVSGFRVGTMAYLTDLKTLPVDAERHLMGLDLLVMSMLRDELHPTHLSWDEAVAIVARLRPRRTVFTHLGPEIRYRDLESRLAPGLELAVDGWHTIIDMT